MWEHCSHWDSRKMARSGTSTFMSETSQSEEKEIWRESEEELFRPEGSWMLKHTAWEGTLITFMHRGEHLNNQGKVDYRPYLVKGICVDWCLMVSIDMMAERPQSVLSDSIKILLASVHSKRNNVSSNDLSTPKLSLGRIRSLDQRWSPVGIWQCRHSSSHKWLVESSIVIKALVSQCWPG